MGEAQRILRYVIPGSLTAGLVTLWLLLDAATCRCYQAPDVDAVVAAAIAASTLPLGFVSAQIAALGGWWNRRWWLTRLDSHEILRQLGRSAPPDDEAGRHLAAALADLELHVRGVGERLSPARERARSLLDLMQALGNGSGAAVLAAGVITIGYVATSLWMERFGTQRLILASGFVLLSVLTGCLMAVSHWRVARSAQAYLEEFMRRTASE